MPIGCLERVGGDKPAHLGHPHLAALAEGCACCSTLLGSFIRMEDGTPEAFRDELKAALESLRSVRAPSTMGSLVAPAQEPRSIPDWDRDDESSWLQSINEASTKMVDLCFKGGGYSARLLRDFSTRLLHSAASGHPALARRGIAARTIAGSPRTVDGLVSVLRRRR
jgi:hypothetical protein